MLHDLIGQIKMHRLFGGLRPGVRLWNLSMGLSAWNQGLARLRRRTYSSHPSGIKPTERCASVASVFCREGCLRGHRKLAGGPTVLVTKFDFSVNWFQFISPLLGCAIVCYHACFNLSDAPCTSRHEPSRAHEAKRPVGCTLSPGCRGEKRWRSGREMDPRDADSWHPVETCESPQGTNLDRYAFHLPSNEGASNKGWAHWFCPDRGLVFFILLGAYQFHLHSAPHCYGKADCDSVDDQQNEESKNISSLAHRKDH